MRGFISASSRNLVYLLFPIAILAAPASASAQRNLVENGGFELAPDFSATAAGTNYFGFWRFFAVSGASASASVVLDAEARSGRRAFRLARLNTAGDCGLDKDATGYRIAAAPERPLRAVFWARSPVSSRLVFALPLYGSSGQYLGVENAAVFSLTPQWQRFTHAITTSAATRWVNISFRSDGVGEFVVDDIALFEEPEARPPQPPVVTLPAGIVTTRRPRFAWRAEPFDAFELAVSATADPAAALWTSGVIESAEPDFACPADLPASQTLFAFARVRNLHGWSAWSPRLAPFRAQPVEQSAAPLHVFDLRYTGALAPAEAFTQAHMVSALQGIVNRGSPRLFVILVESYFRDENTDQYWLDRLREPEGWLEKRAVVPVSTLEALVSLYLPEIRGVVVWDPEVPATSNLASTIAGAESLLPIRYDTAPGSLYSRFVAGGPRLPVQVNLVGKFTGQGTIPGATRASTGSRKCDAYLWALEKYIKTGICDPRYIGYYIDAWWITEPRPGGRTQNHTLTNHDYFTARRAFFCDLSPWGDETPIDDPNQQLGTDLATFKEILLACYNATQGREMIHIGGFTPWAWKYTDVSDLVPGYTAGGQHGGVSTEWEMVLIASAYNAYLDADALGLGAMANASFYSHLPLPDRYAQPLPPLREELVARGVMDASGVVAPKSFVLHYVGDYDSAAWVTDSLYIFWESPYRGRLPLTWAVNPNLSDRAAQFFERALRTRSGLDSFSAGDSGAGYVNPSQVSWPRLISNLPTGEDAWRRHCERYYRRFDYDFTGFLINGHAGRITTGAEIMYQSFSGGGIVNSGWDNPNTTRLRGRMPVFVMQMDLSGNPATDAASIAARAHASQREFLVFRSVLKDVDFYRQVNERLALQYRGLEFEVCDADTFSYLARAALGGENVRFATYLFDTLPRRAVAGGRVRGEIAVRNDGWDTWSATGGDAVSLGLEFTAAGEFAAPLMIPLPGPVEPGGAVILQVDAPAPAFPGEWVLRYEMRHTAAGWFSAGGDLPWIADATIEPAPEPTPPGRLFSLR